MMNQTIEGLLSLLYPQVCPVCGNVLVAGERLMCLDCRIKLPLTNYERNADWNPMIEKLMCHAPITRAAAYFFYQRESPHSRLVHQIKYHGQPRLGRELMREYATNLRSQGFFDGIDAMAPVPLSFSKLILRGYNQSFRLAQGVADVIPLPIVDALRAGRHGSQTRLGALERLRNARGIFSAKAEHLSGINHLLLVDDIVTTGATMCACAEAIHAAAPSIRISVLALASTRLQ